jgi:hypothetical protein
VVALVPTDENYVPNFYNPYIDENR